MTIEIEHEKVKVRKSEPLRFTKEQHVKSKRYETRPDLLNAILKDGQSYSVDEVETRIKEFGKGVLKC